MATVNGEDLTMPGQRLGSVDQFSAGPGTYTKQRHIYASLCGCKNVINEAGKLPVMRVNRSSNSYSLPKIGSIVTAKITNINRRLCRVLIIGIGSTPLKEPLKGTLRKEDVRATEKDKVEMYNCFRSGDVIVAEVISLGDARSYYLTTAKNELGVIFALSSSGYAMIPVSWTKMQCPKTEAKESRKVARSSYWGE